jgi:hypothetical protein
MKTRTPFIAVAVAASLASAHAAEADWDATVKAAIAEGEVDVHGGPGKLYEQVLTEKFKAAFPGATRSRKSCASARRDSMAGMSMSAA